MDERPEDEGVDSAMWHGHAALVTNAPTAEPVSRSTRVNPLEDPLVRGCCGPSRCPGMYDFIDIVIGPEGRPFAVFVDACTGQCATTEGTFEDNTGENMAFDGAVVALTNGPRLRDAAASIDHG